MVFTLLLITRFYKSCGFWVLNWGKVMFYPYFYIKMSQKDFQLTADDGHKIQVRQWQPAEQVAAKGVIHILHGMAEHCARYAELAADFTTAGYLVFAHDHRGHGYSVSDDSQLGHYADDNGWHKVTTDVFVVQKHIKQQYPELPLHLLGHSMGSYIAQQFVMDNPGQVSSLILSGSNAQPQWLLSVLLTVIRFERWRQGKIAKSALIDKLVFGPFNREFEPAATNFDWLCRVPQQVQKYVDDPLCGYLCSNQTWFDMICGLKTILTPSNQARLSRDLPLLILVGDKDPVSNNGKGVKQLAKAYAQQGLKHLQLEVYTDARHELYNETNRQQVIGDTLDFLGKLSG